AAVEDAIASRVRAAVDRGAVAVSVHLAGRAAGLRIDADAADLSLRLLGELAERLALPGSDLALVLAQPGVITAGDADGNGTDNPDGTPAVLAALEAALAQLDRMRQTEGRALAVELGARLDELVAARAQVAMLAAE